nr:hypothetical protein [uncultured Mediterranean phage uvMED]
MKIKKGKKIVYKCINDVMENMPQFAQEHCFQDALNWELKQHNIDFTSQKKLPINYKNEIFVGYFIPDILINFKDTDLILELKRSEARSLDEIQIESYMSVNNTKNIGILVNFREKTIKEYDSKSQTFLHKCWNDFEKTFSQEFTKGHSVDSEILKEIEKLQYAGYEPHNVYIQAKDLYGLISDYSDVTIRKRLSKLKEMGKLIHKDKGYQLKEKNLEEY